MQDEIKDAFRDVVEDAIYLAHNDPSSLLIIKSNMEILKIRHDMQKTKKERPVA